MGEEPAAPGGAPGAPAAPETTSQKADTTTAGAQLMLNTPWLTAAAVALYATRVMWAKFRELGLAKQKKRLEKLAVNRPDMDAANVDGLEKVVDEEASSEDEEDIKTYAEE
ncbi:hypothetical protein KR026_009605, partial [Drosophila bipectinata]